MPGSMPSTWLQRAHLLHFLQLLQKILQRKLRLPDLRFQLDRLFFVELLLRLLDEGDDVAHAKDAGGQSFGMEPFQRLRLFAGADELDRLADRRPQGDRRAAAGIAIHLGEHRTVYTPVAREMPGRC